MSEAGYGQYLLSIKVYYTRVLVRAFVLWQKDKRGPFRRC